MKNRALKNQEPDTDVGSLIAQVATLLRSGIGLEEAWAQALLETAPEIRGDAWMRASHRVAAGEEIGDVLNGLAPEVSQPQALIGAGAASRLAKELGSSAADVLEECVDTVTHLQEAAAERHAALAGPRTTMRVLLALPLVALMLFQGAGVGAIEVLLLKPVGWFCVALGGLLLWWGHRWVNKLLTAAQRGE